MRCGVTSGFQPFSLYAEACRENSSARSADKTLLHVCIHASSHQGITGSTASGHAGILSPWSLDSLLPTGLASNQQDICICTHVFFYPHTSKSTVASFEKQPYHVMHAQVLRVSMHARKSTRCHMSNTLVCLCIHARTSYRVQIHTCVRIYIYT
jgi:hypothetical protein